MKSTFKLSLYTVKDKVIVKENNIDSRKLKFASTLEPFLGKYGRDLLNDFYKYWTEPNKSNTKFKAELEKTWSLERRLETWNKNEFKFGTKEPKSKLLTVIDINQQLKDEYDATHGTGTE